MISNKVVEGGNQEHTPKHEHKFVKDDEPEKVTLYDQPGSIVGHDLFYFTRCSCGKSEPLKLERKI